MIVQAAVEGVVDFSKTRLHDRLWWKRLKILLDGLDDRNERLITETALKLQTAVVAQPRLTNESFEELQTRNQELFWDFYGKLKPWQGRSYAERKKKEVKTHRQAYIDAFGVDPADPKYKEWERKQIAAWRREASKRTESQEEIVARRQMERDRKKQGR